MFVVFFSFTLVTAVKNVLITSHELVMVSDAVKDCGTTFFFYVLEKSILSVEGAQLVSKLVVMSQIMLVCAHLQLRFNVIFIFNFIFG